MRFAYVLIALAVLGLSHGTIFFFVSSLFLLFRLLCSAFSLPVSQAVPLGLFPATFDGDSVEVTKECLVASRADGTVITDPEIISYQQLLLQKKGDTRKFCDPKVTKTVMMFFSPSLARAHYSESSAY
jgi:hypothetical protein